MTATHVYALTQDGYLCVLEADCGKLVEKHHIHAEDKLSEMGLSTSSPFVAGSQVFVGSEVSHAVQIGGFRVLHP